MAIGTDASIEFFGTADSLANTTSAVTDTSFSDGTNDLNAWTNDDDAPFARCVLLMQYTGTLGAAPYVNLHARQIDVDGTVDTPVPDSGYSGGILGRFDVDPNLAASTDDAYVLDVKLPNVQTSQVHHFYIEVQIGATSITAGWDLTVTPITIGPHA